MINKNTYLRSHTKLTDNIIHKKRLEIISIIKGELENKSLIDILDIGTTQDNNKSSNLIIKNLKNFQKYKSISDQKIKSNFFSKFLQKSIIQELSSNDIEEFSSDVVISNATIEHVGSYLDQLKMIENIIKLTKKISKMILISHRGNIDGPNSKLENSPEYIQLAIEKGFDVEVDVWYKNNNWWLGHDEPTYKVPLDFFFHGSMWIHAKNIEALCKFEPWGLNVFWHQNDDFTLTSKRHIWTYPGKKLLTRSICVLPEKANYKEFNCLGICSDLIQDYKK